MDKANKEIRKEKKAYEKPRIVYQQALEATAAVCDWLNAKESAEPPIPCTAAFRS